jgi:hypothetical protein
MMRGAKKESEKIREEKKGCEAGERDTGRNDRGHRGNAGSAVKRK